jgi:hypothetical protein
MRKVEESEPEAEGESAENLTEMSDPLEGIS